MPSSSQTGRPLRRDAEPNRRRILEAAQRLFTERGLDVTHDELARAADVGVGTVYRRFPNREQLIEALFQDRMATVVAFAEEGAELPDSWAGLCRFMERGFELQAEYRGLGQLLQGSSRGSKSAVQAQQRIGPLVGGMVRRAREQGALAEDVGPGDFACSSSWSAPCWTVPAKWIRSSGDECWPPGWLVHGQSEATFRRPAGPPIPRWSSCC